MADKKREMYQNDEEVRSKISKGWFKKGESVSPETQFKAGHTPWHKGETSVYSDEQLENITKANRKKSFKTAGKNNWQWKGGKSKCIDCNKQLSHYRVARCRGCNAEYYSGENSWSWQGGKTSDNDLQRLKFLRTVVPVVLERDDYTCQICDTSGGRLHVDHIKSWSEYPELRFTESNCRALCRACHYYVTFKKIMPSNSKWGLTTVTEKRG